MIVANKCYQYTVVFDTVFIDINVLLLHESLMIVACRNEMCDQESDDESKEQEATYDKPPSECVSRGQFYCFTLNDFIIHCCFILQSYCSVPVK